MEVKTNSIVESAPGGGRRIPIPLTASRDARLAASLGLVTFYCVRCLTFLIINLPFYKPTFPSKLHLISLSLMGPGCKQKSGLLS
jgi:hypothetical protein